MIDILARTGRALIVTGILVPAPAAAVAQQWDLGVAAAASTRSSFGAPLPAIAPTGAVAGRGWRLTSDIGTVDRPRGTELGTAFSAAALGPHLGPVRTEAYGDFASRIDRSVADARVALRLHLAGRDQGVWAGLGAARAGSRLGALRSVGGWLHGRLGSASIRLDQVTGPAGGAGFTTFDTLPSAPIDTLAGGGNPGGSVVSVYHPGSPSVRMRSVSARYSTPGGRLQLSLGAAQMRGVVAGPTQTASILATWWVDRAFALVGGYGPSIGNGLVPVAGAARLGVLWQPFKGRPRTLSLVEPAAVVSATVDRVGDGEWRIRLPADGARSVELQGSFGGWEPVAMHQSGDGWWETTLPLEPGRYELTWRRDAGSWRTLPGLPTVSDDLLGKVSVLVIDRD